VVDDVLRRAVDALGRDIRVLTSGLPGSVSGSGVHRVRVEAGDAVLKVTAAAGRRTGRRELAFYRTLANRVPVETPRVLGFADRDDLTVLLLSAHTPARPAREWDRSSWLAVVRELAALHSFPPPQQEPWLHTPWLRQVLERPPVAPARDYWSRTEAASGIAPALGAAAALAAALDAVPRCFIHGDLHVGNLLRDGDRLLWTDWQVAGIGSPAIDLAFLWLRANADGADLPYEAMLQDYVTRRPVDPDRLRRAVIAAELGFTLFGFPEYAGLRSEHERDRVAHRLQRLITEWIPYRSPGGRGIV
jgi:aminoglycoside phosphotransferase (APT) family kinase protein